MNNAANIIPGSLLDQLMAGTGTPDSDRNIDSASDPLPSASWPRCAPEDAPYCIMGIVFGNLRGFDE